MRTTPHNANGHRRRQTRTRVLAEEDQCALCDMPVDKTLGALPNTHGPRCKGEGCTGCTPHPMRAEVDEDLPRSRGGSPYDRGNTRLMHRRCNQYKSDRTLAEARAKLNGNDTTPLQPIKASPIW